MNDLPDNNKLEMFEDVACTLCGCVCDDLLVTVQENEVIKTDHACVWAEPWLLRQSSRSEDFISIEGGPTTFDDALDKTASLLKQSQFPLVYGLSSSSTPGQRAACELADRLGAVIDTSASTCHAPSIMAMQRIGESTCSLGEIRNRSDLVIFWGSNPVESHPRHLERYSGSDFDFLREAGAHSRKIIVVDTVRTETAEQADQFIQIEPDQDFEILWALRGLVKGIPVEDSSIGGVSREVLTDLAEQMSTCQHGAVFFGLGLAKGKSSHHKVEALMSLVTDLHEKTRFVVRRMRRYGDVAGADSVLCWQTGYPFSVALHRRFPQYNPGEYSAGGLLERAEIDLALLVGTDGVSKLSRQAQDYLAQIPTIVLDHNDASSLPFEPTIRIPVATYGVHLAGTAYRMDETPIPLRPFLKTDLPSDEEILKRLTQIMMD